MAKRTTKKTAGQQGTKAAGKPRGRARAAGKKAPRSSARGARAVAAEPAATPKAPEPKAMSGVDAAAKVLVDSKEPMRAKDIVERAQAKGLWTSPDGKTPAATISAAIGREIRDKGKESRFMKVGRGLFAAAKA